MYVDEEALGMAMKANRLTIAKMCIRDSVMVDFIIINMFYNIYNLLLVNSKNCTFAPNINDVSRTSERGLKRH